MGIIFPIRMVNKDEISQLRSASATFMRYILGSITYYILRSSGVSCWAAFGNRLM